MKNDLNILVIGYDGYSDLWQDFFTLFKKNITFDMKKIFISDFKKIESSDFENIVCNKNLSWTEKLIIGIKKTESKYICLLLDDFYIGNKVDSDILKELMVFIDNNDVDYIKIAENNTINHNKFGKKIENHKYILKSNNSDYAVSLQPSIWKKDFLLDIIGKSKINAWAFESKLNSKETRVILNKRNIYFDKRNILNIKHVAIQGKIIPSTLNYFKRKKIPLSTTRKKMNAFEYMIYILKKVISGLVGVKTKKLIKFVLSKIFKYKFITDKNSYK